jgi:hypothetical protein
MKEKTQAKSTASRAQSQMSDVADKVMKNYEQTIKTGVKLQEEAAHYWTNVVNQAAAPHDWQKRFSTATAFANGLMPAAQKRMEEVLTLMEKNSRTGAELVKKAVDAAQTPVIAESQSKWMDFWASSIGAARANTEALTEIGSRAVDSWVDFIQKNTEITEIRVPKTA